MTTTDEQAMWADALAMAIPIGGLTVEQRHNDLIALADRIIAAGVFSISLGRPAALSSTPEASDDEREALVEAMIGSDALDEDTRMRARDHTDLQREPFRMFADAALAAGFRRSPVPAGTPTIACAVNHGGEPCPGYPHPTQADTPSEGDFPCCDDGEHVPAEIAGDLFTATLNRAQWHRVDEALAAHGRNDAVWSQIAATKSAARPTPPEDVAALVRKLRKMLSATGIGTDEASTLGLAIAALAAVPADTPSEDARRTRFNDEEMLYMICLALESGFDHIRHAEDLNILLVKMIGDHWGNTEFESDQIEVDAAFAELEPNLDHIRARNAARPTPPEDVAAAFDAEIRVVEGWQADDERVSAQYVGVREGLIRGRSIALAAVPADGETEWEYGIQYTKGGVEEFEGESLVSVQRRVASIRERGGHGGAYGKTVRGLRRRRAGDSEPIPESEESDRG